MDFEIGEVEIGAAFDSGEVGAITEALEGVKADLEAIGAMDVSIPDGSGIGAPPRRTKLKHASPSVQELANKVRVLENLVRAGKSSRIKNAVKNAVQTAGSTGGVQTYQNSYTSTGAAGTYSATLGASASFSGKAKYFIFRSPGACDLTNIQIANLPGLTPGGTFVLAAGRGRMVSVADGRSLNNGNPITFTVLTTAANQVVEVLAFDRDPIKFGLYHEQLASV